MLNQRDIWDCNILCFNETWLNPVVPDHAILPAETLCFAWTGWQMKAEGVCFMINNNWCDPRNVSVLSRSCSPQLEHLAILCRPFYLPREFTYRCELPALPAPSLPFIFHHKQIWKLLWPPCTTQHNTTPHHTLLSSWLGIFNKANLTKVMPNVFWHVICPTRGFNAVQ